LERILPELKGTFSELYEPMSLLEAHTSLNWYDKYADTMINSVMRMCDESLDSQELL
jgi:hypothetical protein